jgi:hypothetical protein
LPASAQRHNSLQPAHAANPALHAKLTGEVGSTLLGHMRAGEQGEIGDGRAGIRQKLQSGQPPLRPVQRLPAVHPGLGEPARIRLGLTQIRE